MERFALAGDFLLGALAVRNVAERTDEPDRTSVTVDDQASYEQPAGGVRRHARADLELEPAPLPGIPNREMLLQRRTVFRQDLVKQSGDRWPEIATSHAKDLVQAWREICAIGDDV